MQTHRHGTQERHGKWEKGSWSAQFQVKIDTNGSEKLFAVVLSCAAKFLSYFAVILYCG